MHPAPVLGSFCSWAHTGLCPAALIHSGFMGLLAFTVCITCLTLHLFVLSEYLRRRLLQVLGRQLRWASACYASMQTLASRTVASLSL